MPHDRKGRKLEVGDRVMIPATVLQLFESEEACNAEFAVEAGEGDAAGEYQPTMTFNTRLVEKAE